MVAEHWNEEDGEIIFEMTHFARDKHGLSPKATFCCLINGNSWDEIMTEFHQHMGWEPYRPMP